VHGNRPRHPPSRGRYFMERGWQKHPVFPDEPFTAREAWEWLIAEAYWREGRTRAGKFVATLQRGQLCASVRYLADCWQWEKSKVERFLKRLKTETMIETRSETGINVITICNYEKYQSFAGDGETANEARRETVPRQQRDKREINQEDYTSHPPPAEPGVCRGTAQSG
jgi:DNA-binding transcriptional regulator YhcF (GntR family)